MSPMDIQQIETLAESSGGTHISIYMPAVMVGAQTRQNAIRFKNLLDQAADQLREAGKSPNELKSLFDQANNVQSDDAFWQYQNMGLVVLINEQEMHTFQLPREFNEEVRVSERFYLTPLLQFLYEGGDFYILTLGQKDVRLLLGTPYSVEEVDLDKDVPTSLAEALKFDDPERQLQWHTSTSAPGGTPGRRQAIFHGHGGGAVNDPKDNLLRYFNKLDKGITEMLKDKRSPLVLAGLDYLLPIYKEANSYLHLVETGITQHPKSATDKEMHEEAWKIVQPIFDDAKNEIVGRYEMLKGREEAVATDDLKEVIKAAPVGRVEVLFVDKNASQWGSLDQRTNNVKFSGQDQQGSRDLVQYAALETLRNGGTVYAVDSDELPGGAQIVAAILRY